MNDRQVFYAIRKLGMAVMLNAGEWRIDYKRDDARRTPDSSYFTNDRQDAFNTAIAMAQRSWKVWFMYGNETPQMELHCVVDATTTDEAVDIACRKIAAIADEGFIITGVEEIEN